MEHMGTKLMPIHLVPFGDINIFEKSHNIGSWLSGKEETVPG